MSAFEKGGLICALAAMLAVWAEQGWAAESPGSLPPAPATSGWKFSLGPPPSFALPVL